MTDRYQVLAELYPGVLTRNDLIYPVAVTPLGAKVTNALTWDDAEHPLDPGLVERGAEHLRNIQKGRPHVHDGPVVRWLGATAGQVATTLGGYFDMLTTCDALRDELVNATGSGNHRGILLSDLPLRALAHTAAGDPLISGEGRCAAIGVTVLATFPPEYEGGQRTFMIGRRHGSLATDPGTWHIAPSGTLEPVAGENPVPGTVVAELAEELGITIPVDDARARIEVLGLAFDLMRLRPDLVVRLDLTETEAAQLDPPAEGEFTVFQSIELGAVSGPEFWRQFPPILITSPAAGALALLAGGEEPGP